RSCRSCAHPKPSAQKRKKRGDLHSVSRVTIAASSSSSSSDSAPSKRSDSTSGPRAAVSTGTGSCARTADGAAIARSTKKRAGHAVSTIPASIPARIPRYRYAGVGPDGGRCTDRAGSMRPARRRARGRYDDDALPLRNSLLFAPGAGPPVPPHKAMLVPARGRVLHALHLIVELGEELLHLVAVHEGREVAHQAEDESRTIRDRQPITDLVHDVADRGVIDVPRLGRARRLRHTISSAVYPSSMTAPTSASGPVFASSYSTKARPASRSTFAARTPSTASSASVTARTQWPQLIPSIFNVAVAMPEFLS